MGQGLRGSGKEPPGVKRLTINREFAGKTVRPPGSAILTLGRLRHKDHKLEASLGYTMKAC